MGNYSLNLNMKSTSSTMCEYNLQLSNNTSSLLAKVCQSNGATKGNVPTLSIKQLPKEVNQYLAKFAADQSKPKGLPYSLVSSELQEMAGEITNGMKPSAQSGLGFEVLNNSDFNSAYSNSVQYDPANSESLQFYVNPIGQSAGFSFKIRRKDFEAEFGIHVFAPKTQ